MVLRHGRKAKTIRANIGSNIASELRAGKPFKQAQAVALATARADARRAHIKPASVGVAPKAKG